MPKSILAPLKQYLTMLEASGVDVIPAAPVLTPSPFSLSPLGGEGGVRGKPSTNSSNVILETLRKTVLQCTKCSELVRTRHQIVFGSGNEKAELVFVGEAPGFDEDQQGLPFVGKAGQLLTKIIESIGLAREEVFICNVLKCRPPQNRNPVPEEIVNCQPYLLKQLELIKPRVICALGSFAAKTLLNSDRSISYLRGRFYEFRGSRLMCTFHPAYLLRNPEDKRKVWEDMKMIRAELGHG